MFAKVFEQIFDSSIAEDWQVRHVFEDLLKMADINGVVDKTIEAVARRTNIPIEIVQRAIGELEKPDPESRIKDHEGRRIMRLDDHRSWGWFIVNYKHYRDLSSKEQQREATLARVTAFRNKNGEVEEDVEGKTLTNRYNALQDEQFDKFWSIYPRKQSKKDAKKAWMNSKKNRPDFDEFIQKLIQQIEMNSWTRDRIAFIPLPATYLRGERWNDEDSAPQIPSNRHPVDPIIPPSSGPSYPPGL
jgi:hypothetical protein